MIPILASMLSMMSSFLSIAAIALLRPVYGPELKPCHFRWQSIAIDSWREVVYSVEDRRFICGFRTLQQLLEGWLLANPGNSR